MHRAKLLGRKMAIPLTTGDIAVATDVLLHRWGPYTLEALRPAAEQGLKPSCLNFTGDDGTRVILQGPILYQHFRIAAERQLPRFGKGGVLRIGPVKLP
jgi:hypothetical protein